MSAEDYYYGDNKRPSRQNPYPPESGPAGPPGPPGPYMQPPPVFQQPYPYNQYQYPPSRESPSGYHQQPPPPPPYFEQQPPGENSYTPSASEFTPTATPGPQSAPTDDRGVFGAVAGGAAGAYAGHQVHHGVLGTLGGAIVGSLGEDAIKHKKKEKESRVGFHGRSSSSSASDLEDDKKKTKKASSAPDRVMGNFSTSSAEIALHGNDLVAHCRAISGHSNVSRLALNSVLTNEFGHFKWRRDGNFGASARNVRLTEGGRVLEAELANDRGGWNRSWVRLDERITNQDGHLVFVD